MIECWQMYTILFYSFLDSLIAPYFIFGTHSFTYVACNVILPQVLIGPNSDQ